MEKRKYHISFHVGSGFANAAPSWNRFVELEFMSVPTDAWKDAQNLLNAEMVGQDYSIYYWTWIPVALADQHCDGCDATGTKSEEGICSACGYSHNSLYCPKCGQLYVVGYNEECPFCKARKDREIREAADFEAWQDSGYKLGEEYDFRPGEFEMIRRDWHRGGWLDEQSHEYVGKLLREIYRLQEFINTHICE